MIQTEKVMILANYLSVCTSFFIPSHFMLLKFMEKC